METCESCGVRDYVEEICYGCCDKSPNGTGKCCERCAFIKDNKTKCGKCEENFCDDHAGLYGSSENECCGLALCIECGGGEEECTHEGCDDYEGCRLRDGLDEEKRHKPKPLKCGHEGCNYHEACRMCVLDEENKQEEEAMLADKKLVEDLLKRSTSKSLKKSLSIWMKSVPDEVSEKKRGTSTQAEVSGAAKKHKSWEGGSSW
jgi:hypothetical protein